METNKKPSNPRMHNPDGLYASEARLEDCVTLRDYFANSAMQGLISNFKGDVSANYETIAIVSYKLADAMLKQREQNV
jgi:hypothetical protein